MDEVKVKKEFSARKFMAVFFTITYCSVIIGITIALLKGKLAVETYVALLASFVLIVREITDAYFKREDRITNGGVK